MITIPQGNSAVAELLSEATVHLGRALSREGWSGASRELSDCDIEAWRRELSVLADSYAADTGAGRGG